jgi:hypothetical protein
MRDIYATDKTVVFYSCHSHSRDWPTLERQIALEIESKTGVDVSIYVRLDEERLPQHDQNRIYIDATSKTLKSVGQDILHALGRRTEAERYDYNEDVPL